MAKQTRQNPRTRSAPALPPIPTHTPEGIRAHAIRETIRALDQPSPSRNRLELQPEEYEALGKQLGVPALFVASIHLENTEGEPFTPDHFEEYLAWRQRLAAQGVRPC